MEDSARLFNCALCHELVSICSDCDRGNRYCSKRCSGTARKTLLRESQKRYQLSVMGRMKHAKRQARYRQRGLEKIEKAKKVTHQGSIAYALNDLLLSVSRAGKQRVLADEVKESRCCDFCLCGKFGYFRSGFIRHGVNNTLISQQWPRGP